MINSLKWKFQRAQDVRRNEGTTAFLRKFLHFITPTIYRSQTFFLYEGNLQDTLEVFKDITCNLPDLTMTIISTNGEAAALEAEGFDIFTTFATSDGRNLDYHQRLAVGSTAFCTYIGKIPGAISWIVTTEQAQKAVSDLPMKVDFSNGQAYFLDAWADPKYRREGLSSYNLLYNQFRYLVDNGIKIGRSSVESDNHGSIAFHEFGGFRKYAEARYVKFLWWRYWKETPTPSSV